MNNGIEVLRFTILFIITLLDHSGLMPIEKTPTVLLLKTMQQFQPPTILSSEVISLFSHPYDPFSTNLT